MSIGSRLRQLRKANKLSGDKFGELCDVSKGMVSQWESDQVVPPTDRLLKLHKHLDFSFDWLLGDEEQETYTTSDHTLVEIMRVLEPRADYLKDAAYKAVLTTCELVDQTRSEKNEDKPPTVHMRTVNVVERRRAMAGKSLQPFTERRKKDDKQA